MSKLQELEESKPEVRKVKELEAIIEVLKREFPEKASEILKETLRITI